MEPLGLTGLIVPLGAISLPTELIGLLVPLGAFAMVVAVVYISVTAAHREKIAMIEKGILPSEFNKKPGQRSYTGIRWGFLLAGLGFGLFIANQISTSESDGDVLYPGMMLLCGGIGLILSYVYQVNQEKADRKAEEMKHKNE